MGDHPPQFPAALPAQDSTSLAGSAPNPSASQHRAGELVPGPPRAGSAPTAAPIPCRRPSAGSPLLVSPYHQRPPAALGSCLPSEPPSDWAGVPPNALVLQDTPGRHARACSRPPAPVLHSARTPAGSPSPPVRAGSAAQRGRSPLDWWAAYLPGGVGEECCRGGRLHEQKGCRCSMA